MAQYNSNRVVDHSTVLYSLLGCISIQSNFIDKRKSICSRSLVEGIKFEKATLDEIILNFLKHMFRYRVKYFNLDSFNAATVKNPRV